MLTSPLERPSAAMAPSSSPILLLFCPLCLEQSSERVVILAEYDLRTPVVTMADRVGCGHAELFGQVWRADPR